MLDVLFRRHRGRQKLDMNEAAVSAHHGQREDEA